MAQLTPQRMTGTLTAQTKAPGLLPLYTIQGDDGQVYRVLNATPLAAAGSRVSFTVRVALARGQTLRDATDVQVMV